MRLADMRPIGLVTFTAIWCAHHGVREELGTGEHAVDLTSGDFSGQDLFKTVPKISEDEEVSFNELVGLARDVTHLKSWGRPEDQVAEVVDEWLKRQQPPAVVTKSFNYAAMYLSPGQHSFLPEDAPEGVYACVRLNGEAAAQLEAHYKTLLAGDKAEGSFGFAGAPWSGAVEHLGLGPFVNDMKQARLARSSHPEIPNWAYLLWAEFIDESKGASAPLLVQPQGQVARHSAGGVLSWAKLGPELATSIVPVFDSLIMSTLGDGVGLLGQTVKFTGGHGRWQIFYHMLVPEIALRDGGTKKNELYDENSLSPVIDLKFFSDGKNVLKIGWDEGNDRPRILPPNPHLGSDRLTKDSGFAKEMYQTSYFRAGDSLLSYAPGH